MAKKIQAPKTKEAAIPPPDMAGYIKARAKSKGSKPKG